MPQKIRQSFLGNIGSIQAEAGIVTLNSINKLQARLLEVEGSTSNFQTTITSEVAVASVLKVRKNSTNPDVGQRNRLNFIEGGNITLTLADDIADGEIDINVAVTSTGTATRAVFWTSTNLQGSDAAFYWDNVNKRLGINTTAPSARIHAIGTAEQARFGYDTSNYASVITGSDGHIVIDSTGTTPSIETGEEVPFGINRTPTDAWLEVENVAGDPADVIFNLTPWGWWSADYVSSTGSPYSDGDDLAGGSISWYDRAPGHARPLDIRGAAASQVEYQITGEFTSGKPALSFIDNGRGEFGGLQQLNSYTMFIVHKSTTATSQGSFLFRDNNGTSNPGDFIRPPAASGGTGGTDDNWRVKYSSPSTSLYIPGVNITYTDTSYNVHEVTFNSASGAHAMWINGTSVGSVTDSGTIGATLSFTRMRTISDGSAGVGLDNVYIAEIIVFSSVLSAPNRVIVETYLNNKYGLNGGSPVTGSSQDYARFYNSDLDVLARVDDAARVAFTDVDSSAATLASRLTLWDAGGDMFDMSIDGVLKSHWELTPITSTDKTITIPNATGTLLLSSNIGTTVQAWDVDLDEIAAQANVRGDLLVTNSGPNWVRLPIGASATLLRSDGTDAAWASLATAGIQPLDTDLTEIAAVANVRGDLLVTDSTPSWVRLGIGAANRVLGVNNGATDPEYKDILGTANEINITHAANSITIGIVDPLIAAKGGTGFASYAVGDVLYADTTSTLAKLADVATGNALISGGVTTAPSWGKIGLATHVSGRLPYANLLAPTTTSLLLGRNSSTTGDWQEVTLGSGIAMSAAAVLSATGSGGTVTGTGTTNTLPKWTSTSGALGDSGITDDGNTVIVGSAFGTQIKSLNVSGFSYNTRLTIDGGVDDGSAIFTNTDVEIGLLSTGAAGKLLFKAGALKWSTFKAQAQAATINYTLPAAGGTGILHNDSSNVWTWSAVALGGADVSGTLLLANGGTGLTSWTQGDIPYFTSGTALSKLAKDANATRYLSNQGTSNAPSWNQVNLANGVTGTLVATNMGALTGEVTSSAGSFATAIERGTTFSWTGAHTFTLETLFPGGIDMSTGVSNVGRFDSQVTDASTARAFLFQPTNAITATVAQERSIFRINNSAASPAMIVWPDLRTEFGGASAPTSASADGTLVVAASIANTAGIFFAPSAMTSAGAALAGLSTTTTGAYFASSPDSASTCTNTAGGIFVANVTTGAPNDRSFYGGVFRASQGTVGATNTGRTWGFYGWKVQAPTLPVISNTRGTVGNLYGGYIAAATGGYTNAVTNEYQLYIEEATRGATIKDGIFLANATAGYKAIAIRDQDVWIGSNATGELSLNGSTFNVVFLDNEIVSYDDDLVTY